MNSNSRRDSGRCVAPSYGGSQSTAAIMLLLALVQGASAQNVMTLKDCTDYALRHSRELARRQLALEGQELTTRIQRGKFRPDLIGSAERGIEARDSRLSATVQQEVPAGITASATGTASQQGSGEDQTENASLSVKLSKVIIGGGSWRESMLEIDNSILGELIDRNRVQKYERELVYSVKQDYYGLIRSQQTLRINELKLARSRKNLEHALERERPLDIATARIEVPESEAGVLRAKRQIQSALDELKVLIGMEVTQEIETETSFEFAEHTLDVEADTAFAITNHEDILNAHLAKKQLENELPVQSARRWPKVTLSATSGRDSADGFSLDGDTETAVGLAFAWEPGGTTERLKTRKLATTIAADTINIDDLKQTKIKSIRDLGRRITETLQLVRIQQDKIKVAELRSELYADRWDNGEIDILEYVRSQNDLENSRIQLINLQTTYMELLSEYEFAVGR